jgi:hypothetical protein
MNWLDQHAGSIQAIASIVAVSITAVLAVVTWRYVRLTRTIADSSVEQVRYIKEAAQAGQRQNLLALQHLAFRMRVTLEAVSLTRPGILSYSQPTENDVADLDALARLSPNTPILKSARTAVMALRNILKIVAIAQESDRPGHAWTPAPKMESWWNDAKDVSLRSLHEIVNECARMSGV